MDNLSREKFNRLVFERDNHKCVLCGEEVVDAHHIIDRSLFEDGGYYLNNGASVCSDCHWDCELTLVHPHKIREKCGIEKRVLPSQASEDRRYDKWLNVITGEKDEYGRDIYLKGPLFDSESFQKILDKLSWEVKSKRVYI